MACSHRTVDKRRGALGRLVGLAIVVSTALLQTADLGYPSSSEISNLDLAVVVEDFATLPLPGSLSGRLSRVNVMRSEPGDASPFSTRTFVGDLKRYLYILDLNTKQFITYINFEDVFPKFVNGTSYGTGFATFAFDPDYQRNGRFYTVHTEGPNLPGSATPSNANLAGLDLSAGYATTASIDPPVGTVARHAVLVEWTDIDLSTSVFEGTAREVLRVGFTHGNHSIADMTFNPVAQPGDSDYGNLYIALGDGGAGQDDDAGHSIPQRLDAMPGKVLRVTPDISLRPGDLLAANGRYRIPATGADPNPFVTLEDPSVKKEIFAYGFRNPQRMSWDPITNSLIVADIGLYAWEELNILRKGANYGYAEREGSEQLFVGGLNDGRTGSQTMPPTGFPSPDTLDVSGIAAPVVPTYPVAGYSHRDGDAIAGGFVYRGTRMPQLYGKYIFGDVSTARVFYVDVADMIAADDGDPSTLAPITELNVVFDNPNDSPDLGPVAMRLFDVIANQYAYRGGSTGDGAALPEAGGHLSDDVDNAGVPFGGGRADIRFSVDQNGEFYILSKSDGMIRAIVGARGGGTRTVLTTTPNPSSSDAPLELNARVTAYRDVPVGSVEFYDGGLSLGTAVVSAGIATLTTSELAPGLHLLKARFAPSGPEFLGSASGLSHFVSAPATYPIDVTLAGSGGGTVSSSPAGIACPTTCIASFTNGEAVTLVAAPNTTSMFVGWSGACTGTGSCNVTVDTAASVTATFAPGQADLVSVLGSTPSIATPGGLLALAETTVNDGTAMAATSTTRYYLSLDTYKGAGDVTLGSRAISTLAVGASSQGNPSFTIPTTTVVGSYRVLACADDTAKVLESDENNNCAASTTTVSLTRPDLVVSAVSSPGGYFAPGGTFTVSDTVINQGGYSSGVSTTRYYLSIDATKSAGDVVLTGTRSVPALTSSGASAGSATVTIPASTALATYYVVACADDLKKVIELQEGNNCRASGTQLAVSRPDLFTSAVSNPPSQTAPGRSFSLTDTVLNQGQVGATASSTRYYLSADAVKDVGDVPLSGTRSVAVLSPAAGSTGNRSVRVPDTTPTGTYLALACADDLLKVTETNESNNCAVSSGSVQVLYPDLVQTAVSSPPTASAVGATFSVTDTVAAAAAIATTATTTRYYLSSDTIKDASDVLLTGTRGVPAIPAGGSNTGTRVVTIPLIPSGTYYLLACADDTKLAIESDESNNCLAAAVTITIY